MYKLYSNNIYEKLIEINCFFQFLKYNLICDGVDQMNKELS